MARWRLLLRWSTLTHPAINRHGKQGDEVKHALRYALLRIFFEAGAVGNQSRCVYFYLCSLDVCQNPPGHQICAYLCPYLCVYAGVLFILSKKVRWAVCVVKYAWSFVCIQGCKWIAFPKDVNSCQRNAFWPGTFKSYGNDLHESNPLDSTMTNCKLCLTFVYPQ